jgi:hypothetical protein
MDGGDYFKNEAKDFAERFLVETGNASLAAACLTDEGRSELKRGLHNLEGGFHGITIIFDGIRERGHAATAEYGFECLWKVMAGAFVIGRATVTDDHKNFLVKEPAAGGGKKGGATHRARAEVWHVEARGHLSDVEKNNPGLSPRKLAPFGKVHTERTRS